MRHSKRGGKTNLYPGNDYYHLASFLQQHMPNRIQTSWNGPLEPFVVLYYLYTTETPSTKFDSDSQGLQTFRQHQRVGMEHPQLVFLRGFPSPEWLQAVFVMYGVDPALYHRHFYFTTLSVGESGNHYTIPLLPSFSNMIFGLNIITICSDDTENPSALAEDIENLRREASENLRRYHLDLTTNSAVGDSIVRQFSVLSRRFRVVEQTVSIGIHKTSDSWNGEIASFKTTYHEILGDKTDDRNATSNRLDGQCPRLEQKFPWPVVSPKQDEGVDNIHVPHNPASRVPRSIEHISQYRSLFLSRAYTVMGSQPERMPPSISIWAVLKQEDNGRRRFICFKRCV